VNGAAPAFLLDSSEPFRFDAVGEGPGQPKREAMRRAIYAGGVFAATGQLSLAGYEDLGARAAAHLDAMTEGALRQLAMEGEP
jgi:hypothetical protein